MITRLFGSLSLLVAMACGTVAQAGYISSGQGSIDSINGLGEFVNIPDFEGYFPVEFQSNLPLPFVNSLSGSPIHVDQTQIVWTPEGMGADRFFGGVNCYYQPTYGRISTAPGTGISTYRPSGYEPHSYPDIGAVGYSKLTFEDASMTLYTDDTRLPDGSYPECHAGVDLELAGSVAPGGWVSFRHTSAAYFVHPYTGYWTLWDQWQNQWVINTPGPFSIDFEDWSPWRVSYPHDTYKLETSFSFSANPGTGGSASTIYLAHGGGALLPPDSATARTAISATLLAGPTVDFGVFRHTPNAYGRVEKPVLSVTNVAGEGTVIWGRPEDYTDGSSFRPGNNWLFGPIRSGETEIVSYYFCPRERGVYSNTVVLPDGIAQSELTLTGTAVGPVIETGLAHRTIRYRDPDFPEWPSYISLEADVLSLRVWDLSSQGTVSFDLANATPDPEFADTTLTDLTLGEIHLWVLENEELDFLGVLNSAGLPVSVQGPAKGTVLHKGQSAAFNVTAGPFQEPVSYAYVLELLNDKEHHFGDYGDSRYFLLDVTVVAEPLPGDSDGDGDIDFADFNNLANNYTGNLDPGTGGKEWWQGDFDGDGDVDFTDFNNLANHYTGALKMANVPEPSTLALLAMAAVALLAYAWRRRRLC